MQPIDLIPNKEERWTACVPLPLLLLRYKYEIKRKKKRFFMAYELEERLMYARTGGGSSVSSQRRLRKMVCASVTRSFQKVSDVKKIDQVHGFFPAMSQ